MLGDERWGQSGGTARYSAFGLPGSPSLHLASTRVRCLVPERGTEPCDMNLQGRGRRTMRAVPETSATVVKPSRR